MIAWMVLPSTCPASTAAREIAIVRNRAVMPSVMSIATVVAAPPAVPAIVISQDARHDVREVRLPPAGRVDAGQAGPERAAEDEHEQQQEHHRRPRS